jgi:pimeloyl-ACP methyl ester carboxylesterase
MNRKAKNARDNAIDVANEACLMVFAPLLDKKRFPNWRYHRAGIFRKGHVQPSSQWTAPMIRALIDFARKQVDNPSAKLYLFGHSAGGQFLSRLAAYTPLQDVDRIIIANPSVYVAPKLTEDAPYGFAGIFNDNQAQRRLASYLSSPITIFVGEKDIGDKYLVNNSIAQRQGKNRYERGRNIFNIAKQEASSQNLTFSWKLVEACGIGHSSSGMLNSDEMLYALGLYDNQQNIHHFCNNRLSPKKADLARKYHAVTFFYSYY